MKQHLKTVLISFLVLGTLSLAGVLWLVFGPKQPMEEILPSGALAYLRLERPSLYWQKGVKSEFFNQMASIDMANLLAHNKMPPNQIKDMERLRDHLVVFFKNPLTQKFLEKEMGVAVYQLPAAQAKKQDKFSFSAVMVLRLPVSMRAVMVGSAFTRQIVDQLSMKEETYNGRRVVHVKLKNNGFSFKYLIENDFLVIGMEDDPVIYQVIHVIEKKQPSLAKDAHFDFALKHAYQKGDSVAFVDLEQLPFNKTGLKTYAFSFMPGEVNKYRFTLAMDTGKKPALIKLDTCQAQGNGSLSFIPSNIVTYQWSTCYDFNQILEQASKEMQSVQAGDKQTRRLLKGLEKRLGMSIKQDLLPVLGQEAGGYLTDIDTLGVFPYPRFLAFIKVNDRQKAESILNKTVSGHLGIIQQEKYNQVAISYLSLPLGSNTDPGYCFVGDYLLLASSRQLLKKSIDTYKNPESSLKSERNFVTFSLHASPEAQSVTYVKMGDFSRRLKDIFQWTQKYVASRVTEVMTYQQEGNQRKGEIFDEIAAKEEEIKLASSKLKELEAKELAVLTEEDQEIQKGNMKNIKEQLQSLQEEIDAGHQQVKDIDQQLQQTKLQADQTQEMMYNAQHVIVPLLNGLQSLNALGMRVYVRDKIFETELLVK